MAAKTIGRLAHCVANQPYKEILMILSKSRMFIHPFAAAHGFVVSSFHMKRVLVFFLSALVAFS